MKIKYCCEKIRDNIEDEYNNFHINRYGLINIVGEITTTLLNIEYCPFCGAKLNLVKDSYVQYLSPLKKY